jgi:hypothetical protein
VTSQVSGQANGQRNGRVSGPVSPVEPDLRRGWFPADAERHRRDAPRYCPACAAPLALADGGQGLATEYWTGQDRVFACFCGGCGWAGDIVLAARVIGHEAAG